MRDAVFALFENKPKTGEWDTDEARRVADELSAGDHVIVTYRPKNREGGVTEEKTVMGTVASVAGERVSFTRDRDGHTMYLDAEGLNTARSAFPFVGTPLSVENDR